MWDPHWYGPTKTLDVHVASLRKKLGDPGWIETVRGVGFRLARPHRVTAELRVKRRLLFSYLSITAFVLLVLEIPLGRVVRELGRAPTHQRSAARRVRARHPVAGAARRRRRRARCGRARALQALADRYHANAGGRVVIVDADGRSVADSDTTSRDRARLLDPPRDRSARSPGPR